MNDVFQKLWNLRTHPFNPEFDPKGQRIAPNLLLGSLDPTQEPRLLDFYYDVYDWKHNNLIADIDCNAVLRRFPTRNMLADPKSLMILICGPDDTGCESLKNLIIHKVKKQHIDDPIVVKADLVSNNNGENIKLVARLFMRAYAQAVPQASLTDMSVDYKMETEGSGAGKNSYYASLFQIWETYVRGKSKERPIVLLLSGADQYETWRVAYYSVGYLFNYIIVITKDEQEAMSANLSLKRDAQNVALIKVRELTINDAQDYLQKRIQLQKIQPSPAPGAAPLTPFADDALLRLYQPGSKPKQQGDVTWSIGWLNKRLHRVLEERMNKLAEIAKQRGLNAPQDLKPQDLNPQELIISGDDLFEVSELINKGE